MGRIKTPKINMGAKTVHRSAEVEAEIAARSRDSGGSGSRLFIINVIYGQALEPMSRGARAEARRMVADGTLEVIRRGSSRRETVFGIRRTVRP